MIKRKRKVALIVLLVMLAVGLSQVYANNINKLKNDQKNLKNQMNDTKKQIKDISVKTKTISDEISDLDKKMEESTIEIEKAQEQIKKLQADIEVTAKELEESEIKLTEKRDLFNKRIRVMYMNGSTGYLELLLSSKDVKDFLSRKDMVQSIAEHDKELLKFMKEQRDEIDNKKIKLEAQRASVEASKSKLESRRKDLEQVSRQKSDLMGRLKQDLNSLEKEYDKLNSQAKDIESQIVKMQVNTGPYSGGKMQWPVPSSMRITSKFGYRNHPILKKNKLHTGIDIGASSGQSVVAAADGTVVHSGWQGSYGKAVIIDHGGGIMTLYAHNSSLLVSKGQKVSRGSTIAKIGSTGFSTGPHLHFEVRKNGKYVDPTGWLSGK